MLSIVHTWTHSSLSSANGGFFRRSGSTGDSTRTSTRSSYHSSWRRGNTLSSRSALLESHHDFLWMISEIDTDRIVHKAGWGLWMNERIQRDDTQVVFYCCVATLHQPFFPGNHIVSVERSILVRTETNGPLDIILNLYKYQLFLERAQATSPAGHLSVVHKTRQRESSRRCIVIVKPTFHNS